METCKYGSGAGKRKPTAVKRKGVVCRAYKSTSFTTLKVLNFPNSILIQIIFRNIYNKNDTQ